MPSRVAPEEGLGIGGCSVCTLVSYSQPWDYWERFGAHEPCWAVLSMAGYVSSALTSVQQSWDTFHLR